MNSTVGRAACAGEAQNASDDVGWAGGDIGDHGALAAAGGPAGGWAGLGQIALARFENDTYLVHAGRDVSGGGRGAGAGCRQGARRRSEREVRGVGHAGDLECAVVTGDADSRGGDELANGQSVRGGRLNGGGCRSGGSTAGGCESRCACDVGELRAAQNRDDWKRAVVAGDADARDRFVTGHNHRIEKNDVVHDVTVILKPERPRETLNVKDDESSITTQSIDTASAVHGAISVWP